LLKSWPRMVSMAYYPTVTMIMWAFVTVYLRPTSNFLADAPGLFIGAVLLWDILFRGQLGVSLTFFEEMYSRNLFNFLKPAISNGEIALDWKDEVFLGAVLTHDGEIKHEATRNMVEGVKT